MVLCTQLNRSECFPHCSLAYWMIQMFTSSLGAVIPPPLPMESLLTVEKTEMLFNSVSVRVVAELLFIWNKEERRCGFLRTTRRTGWLCASSTCSLFSTFSSGWGSFLLQERNLINWPTRLTHSHDLNLSQIDWQRSENAPITASLWRTLWSVPIQVLQIALVYSNALMPHVSSSQPAPPNLLAIKAKPDPPVACWWFILPLMEREEENFSEAFPVCVSFDERNRFGHRPGVLFSTQGSLSDSCSRPCPCSLSSIFTDWTHILFPLAFVSSSGGRGSRSGRGGVDPGGEERLLEPAGVQRLCCLGVYPGGGWQPGGGDGIPGLLRCHPGAEELPLCGETWNPPPLCTH